MIEIQATKKPTMKIVIPTTLCSVDAAIKKPDIAIEKLIASAIFWTDFINSPIFRNPYSKTMGPCYTSLCACSGPAANTNIDRAHPGYTTGPNIHRTSTEHARTTFNKCTAGN